MQAVFKYELDNTEIENIKKYCDSSDYFSLEQSLGFTGILYKTKIRYFYLIDGGIIKSYSQVNENFKFALIWYGPVCCDRELMITSINEIINFYKKNGFWYLSIQMYFKSGFDTDYIEYALNQSHVIKYFFDKSNTKTSLEIDLAESIDDIYGKIRKGHKSDIKKAIRSGLKVEPYRDTKDLDSFIEVYLKMCKVRGIRGHSSDEMHGICDYIIKNNKGQILLAVDNDDVIIGGIILANQGISVRYLIGASDPDRRDVPVLHLAIYRAIEKAKGENFRYFDFWGYNHFAGEGDQIDNINHFKKGFGGYYTFFAKKMNIELIPYGLKFYLLAGQIRKLKSKLH